MDIIPVLDPPLLPPRQSESNKGDYGKVLIVAGSRGMAGAAVLCGSAALRGGAGLVRVAVAREIQPTVAGGNPCYTTIPLPQDDQGRLNPAALLDLRKLALDCDVVALGPGLGRGHGLTFLVTGLVESLTIPLVLDADGLNAVANDPTRFQGHAGPIVITPHPGEFARLLSLTIPEVQAQRTALARRFALEHKLVVVLKGHRTIVTDGQRVYENATGNPGMATGGAGDVLTGIIAALIGQGLAPFDAAILGVYRHGLAGDLAAAALGEVSLIASDLLTYLPEAFRHGRIENGPDLGHPGTKEGKIDLTRTHA